MGNSSDTVRKEVLFDSKSFAVSGVLAGMFDDFVIKTLPSDVESHKK